MKGFSRFAPGFSRRARSIAAILAVASALGLPSRPAQAQLAAPIAPVTRVPSVTYAAGFVPFYDGDYRQALNHFRSEARGSIKFANVRWIDSICYYAMVGECYYQMGRLPEALDSYNAALEIYLANPQWLVSVHLAGAIRPSPTAAAVALPWGRSGRQSRVGQFASPQKMSLGSLNPAQALQSGGVVQAASMATINSEEIVRCTALALRRRREIMGVACKHDPLTKRMVSALVARPARPNHWSEAWVDVQLGLAYACEGKIPQALLTLERGSVAGGQFDHPLTCVALLELGKLALEAGDLPAAAMLLAEASYSAAMFSDWGVVEEALRYGLEAHVRANSPGIYPALAPAATWAQREGLRQLRTSLLLSAAENAASLGQTGEAGNLLGQARATIGRRAMGAGRIGARLNYLTALVNFQKGNLAGGEQALALALAYQETGSHRLFELGLVDRLYTSGGVTTRAAMELYEHVLRDHTPIDWASNPLESLSVLMMPHPGPYEHWFEVAIDRKEHERALEIADLARRHRFHSTLPLGGRLLALGWVLGAHDRSLDQAATLQRQDLLTRYPEYEQLARRARQLQEALAALPLATDQEATAQQQAALVAELGQVSAAQELRLRELALRREPSSFVFPPLRTTAEVRSRMEPGQALLVFFRTSRQIYAFLLTSERYAYWAVESPVAFNKRLVGFLRELGQFDANRELDGGTIKSTAWKKQAKDLLERIMKGSGANLAAGVEELVIVPDGETWYVPFEALQIGDDEDDLQPLISKIRIRYAPTMGLAVLDGRPRKHRANLAVVPGRLFPRQKPEVSLEAFEALKQEVPEAIKLDAAPQPAEAFVAQIDRLVVYDDLASLSARLYGWSPAPFGGRGGPSLSDWMALPWSGPDVVVLPGFHTAAENGLKRVPPLGVGSDMFLNLCGLMAGGSRTVLISRWRAGGQTSFDLVRNFVRELSETTAADAWQKSVEAVRQEPVDAEREPRVRRLPPGEEVKAEHPFFWAGYLLVDPGKAATPQPDPGGTSPLLLGDETDVGDATDEEDDADGAQAADDDAAPGADAVDRAEPSGKGGDAPPADMEEDASGQPAESEHDEDEGADSDDEAFDFFSGAAPNEDEQ